MAPPISSARAFERVGMVALRPPDSGHPGKDGLPRDAVLFGIGREFGPRSAVVPITEIYEAPARKLGVLRHQTPKGNFRRLRLPPI